MNSAADDFEFTNDVPAAGDTTLVVRMPARLNRKRRVLAEYARQLRLPDYFGWNWDAFEECLRDFSWLTGVEQVVIVHRDIPFARSPENRQTYLSILHDRLQEPGEKGPSVRVLFPTSARRDVQNVNR